MGHSGSYESVPTHPMAETKRRQILRLTDIVIRNLPPPPQGAKVYPDDQLDGFGIRVSQGGTKAFVLSYGRSRERMTIGRYPVLSLADARAEAKRILAERTLGKHRPARMSFDDALNQFVASHLKVKTREITAKGTEALIRNHFPRLKGRFLEDIRVQDITRSTDALLSDGKQGAAAHAHTAIGTLLRWCVRRRYLHHNPIEGIDKPAKPGVRERVLTDDELRQIIVAAPVGTFYGNFVHMLILTGQRRSEIAGLHADWVDRTARQITLPKAITKNNREHVFPYGDWVAEVLTNLPKEGFLFPARGRDAPFSGFSAGKRRIDRECAIEQWTLHDLRRTLATGWQRLGIRIEVTEAMLNHVSGTRAGIVGIYQRHTYLEEMRAAQAQWEKHVAALITPP